MTRAAYASLLEAELRALTGNWPRIAGRLLAAADSYVARTAEEIAHPPYPPEPPREAS